MIQLFGTAWGVLSAAAVFLVGLPIVLIVGRRLGVGGRRIILLYVWHTIFCVAYAVFVLRDGGDALDYFEKARGGTIYFGLGTDAVRYVVQLLFSAIGLEFLGISL